MISLIPTIKNTYLKNISTWAIFSTKKDPKKSEKTYYEKIEADCGARSFSPARAITYLGAHLITYLFLR